MNRSGTASIQGVGIFAATMAVICILTPAIAVIVGNKMPFLENIAQYLILLLFLSILVTAFFTFYIDSRKKNVSEKTSDYFVNRKGRLKVRIWKILPWVFSLVATLLLTFCSILAFVNSVLSEVN